MTDVASEPGVRRAAPRRTRRPIPALVFLLLLALAALAVWFNVLGDEKARDEERAAACSSAVAAVPTAVDPATVTVNVLNASDVAGRAAEVAETLRSRSFQVGRTENDRADNEVTGVGEVRYGPGKEGLARFVALQLPGATLRQDTRADASIDIALGPDFAALASPDAVAAALVPPTGEAGACATTS
ncbi:LytR C-terminal domain-containing protein [Modestobacter sp. SSW1-42]|uniref:LytR C-terminal domain-containing protein n=1 Tax=Modestobacter sp. SSW1-42 TaxID=596372 RepID=UPI003985916B